MSERRIIISGTREALSAEDRHGEERERLRAAIVRGLGRYMERTPVLSTDTLRTIAAALRADPATEGA